MNIGKDAQLDHQRWQHLCRSRRLAIPSVVLLLSAWFLFILSTINGLDSTLPILLAVILNTVAVYVGFSVLHDASHRAISKWKWLNDTVGQCALLMMSPVFGFYLYRRVHHFHHKHTNHSLNNDPDLWLAHGPKWLLPIKWMFMDSHYVNFYLRHIMFTSMAATIWGIIAALSFLSLMAIIIVNQWFTDFVIYWLIPTRVANLVLSWSFAFIPHSPHKYSVSNDPNETTNPPNTENLLATILLIGHNYHRLHHLYPNIPFYRYKHAWQLIKQHSK